MTENLLTAALAAYLRGALSGFALPAPDGSQNSVGVYEGYLPSKKGAEGETFPFALVRPLSGSLDHDAAETEVDVIFGAYSTEDMGYQYALNLLRRGMQALLSLPGGILADRYVLDLPLSWEMSEDQPWPAWQSVLHAKFRYMGVYPVMSDGFGVEVTGTCSAADLSDL